MSVLTASEQIRLHEQEARITQAFYEAGQALAIIRDERLYRANYRNFEDYCVDRWHIRRDYADKMIRAGAVVEVLHTNGMENLPSSERAARPLAELAPEQQPRAWESAQIIAGDRKPTASHSRRAAAAAKSQSAGPAIGQTVTVLDEDSPHYGKQVTVTDTASNGLIVQCQVEGEEQPQPFLKNEVGSTEASNVTSADREQSPQTAPKPNPIEALQTALDIEQARVAILEEILTRMISAARSGADLESLAEEAEQLLA